MVYIPTKRYLYFLFSRFIKLTVNNNTAKKCLVVWIADYEPHDCLQLGISTLHYKQPNKLYLCIILKLKFLNCFSCAYVYIIMRDRSGFTMVDICI